jgi:serine/threonine protein phosphatase PrpC
MEDTWAAYLEHELHYNSAKEPHLASVDIEEGESKIVSPWALFGVFDGHGGAVRKQ